MPARFILSFDCEGKWGLADALTQTHRRDLSDDKLRVAYGSIVDLLDEYAVDATFAFTGAFTQSPADFARIRPEIERLSRSAPAYLGALLRDVDESGGDGWHGHNLVDAVTSARSSHEIALHGVTHVPWTLMDAEFAEAEMRLLKELSGPIRDSRTFVYPRNLVAHADVLAERGFEGFRTARPHGSRLGSFLSEFNLFEAPERPGLKGRLIQIPAGFFLNWRHGVRLLVPPAITRCRVKGLLARASATDAVVHFWSHPENVASAPSTLELLRSVVREVAQARDAGRCEVLTQLGYCRCVGSLN